jgi:hypothetical protein
MVLTTMTPLVALVLTTATSPAPPIHTGNDTTAWKANADGGHPPAIAAVVIANEPAVRFAYVHQQPGWGNAAHAVAVPPSAYAIRLSLRKILAKPGATLHIWLCEADGDAWLARVKDAGGDLDTWTSEPREIEATLADMSFQPRGNGRRELTTANKLLLGFNGADSEVAVSSIAWLTAPQPATTANRPATATGPATRGGGSGPTIAIFADPRFGVMRDASCAPADPAYLAGILERNGYTTALLTAEHLSDPNVLRPDRFPLLVLPYGPAYPAGAEAAIRAYLMHGGCFFSTGGYVFDRPVYFDADGRPEPSLGARRLTAAQLEKDDAFFSFNTRYGRRGDNMATRPDQIGAFDPAFELERVARLVGGDDQFIAPADFEWALPTRGYAARSMIAKNSPVFPDLQARTIPILEARDAFGRPRGPVGSIACVFDGPYRGSAWGFFGVTSHDLFAADAPNAPVMADIFRHTVDALLARHFLYDLRSDLACYRDEKRITLSVRVANLGGKPLSATVLFTIAGKAERAVPVSLAPGEIRSVDATMDRPAEEANPQPFTAELVVAGKPVDRIHGAYVAWRPPSRAAGFDITLTDNYFRHAGRAVFLTGTNTTGEMFYSLDEGPLTWDQDFSEMTDAGVRLLRILHFSPFAHRGYQGDAAHTATQLAQRPPERLIRQMDAVVQLAGKHGIVIFLTLHDWLPIAMSDAELDAERTWDRFWAGRYKNSPGILYDIQNEPNARPDDDPALQNRWEAFLAERYGSLDNAWKAWARPGGRPDPIPRRLPPSTPAWQDLHARDWDRFRDYLLERWLQANAAGIREGDPDGLFTIGLLQTPGAGDPAIAARAVRFSNCHFYGNVHDLAAQLRFIDRRAYGKTMSLGEFGSIPMHDCRTHGGNGVMPRESIDHYLNVGHYALGLGAGFICNWSLKDFAGAIFPWGIRHVGQGRPVPKDLMLAYRNFSLLARRIEPVYRTPELALLLPDGNRFGAHAGDMQNALYASITALIRLGVPFNVINEEDLAAATLPTKAVVWPCPYAVDDDVFARVLAFVKNGGRLYVSGSVAFSMDRKPTRADRAAALGLEGMSFAPPWPRETAPKPQPAVESTVGKGKVHYVPWPVEIAAPEALVETYRRFCEGVPVERANVQPDDASDSVFRLPTKNGELLVIVRRHESEKTYAVTLGTLPLELHVQGKAPAMVWVEEGRLRAASLKGGLAIKNTGGVSQSVITSEGLAAVVALGAGNDVADLRTADIRLILPFEPGRLGMSGDPARGPYRVQLGDISAGRWQALRSDPPVGSGGRLAVPIEADTCLDMRWVAPASETNAAAASANAWLAD